MKKTIFSGITVLAPDESIVSDNGAFTGRDREEIDRALKIGVKTHRHDGSAGLTDPVAAPSAEILASGGMIPGDLGITIGYTLLDLDGGETLISETTLVTTPSPLEVPLVAPVGVFSSAAGALMVDTYTYALTYTDGEGGETPVGPSITVDRPPGFENGQIELSGLAVGLEEAEATGWRLYRARGGGSYVLLTTGDETEDTFIDNGGTEPDCDTHPPTDNINTTKQTNRLKVTLPSASPVPDATFINLYASLTGEFGENSLLEQYPAASAGVDVFFESLNFAQRQPPDVNRSYGGAPKLDPDTELLDFHWKRPVNTVGDLPIEDNEEGDVRAILEEATPTMYMFLDGEWVEVQTGGGAGGGAIEMQDHFSGSALGVDWGFAVGEFPLEETQDLIVSGEFLKGSTGDGGQLVRKDLSLRRGLSEIDFKINSVGGGNYQVGTIAKWIDEDNYLLAWTYEGFPYIEVLGKWEGVEVINIFDDETTPVPTTGEIVTMRLHFSEEGIKLEWVEEGESSPSYVIEHSLEELKALKAGEPAVQEALEALLEAEGAPGVLLQPQGSQAWVDRWRAYTEPTALRLEGNIVVTQPDGTIANLNIGEGVRFWRTPVNNAGELPTEGNEEGDVRAILEASEPTFYVYLGGAWQLFQAGGRLGDVLASGGLMPVSDAFSGVLDPAWDPLLGSFYFENETDVGTLAGVLQPEGSNNGGALLRSDAKAENGTMRFKFRTPLPTDWETQLGIFPKWVDSNNYIELHLNYSFGSIENVGWEFYGFFGGVEVVFDTGSFKLDPEEWYWVECIVDGALLQVNFYDSDPALGSPTPLETIEHTLSGSPEDAFIDEDAWPGVGLKQQGSETPPEIVLDDWSFEEEGANYEYVVDPERLIFKAGSGILIEVDEAGEDAVVTISASGDLDVGGAIGVTDGEDEVDPTSLIEFVGSGVATVDVEDDGEGKAKVTISAISTGEKGEKGDPGDEGAEGPAGSGITVRDDDTTVNPTLDIEFIGSGGVNVEVTEDGANEADVLIEGPDALLMGSGMGVIVIPTSEKGMARPNDFKQYIWFCKEEPENLGDFDIWIEEGP